MPELAKAYDPGAIEERWAEKWVREKLFEVCTPEPASEAERQVFTILLPPPNVTGRLHMGHMLNHTEMDIITRWQRMRGKVAVWVPGTDHAGIATQMMVEKQLAAEGIDRRSLGRENFVERVWKWREHYGGEILRQMKRLGDSVDWSREYFTMDDGLSAAVREVFVRLYEEGLIYRGKYIVNWCPRCVTAISDLEVRHEEISGKLYEIRYPVIGSNEFITVATTRPETMLGDTAVAVNAADRRYRHLHGKRVMLPLMEREIPIILDDLAKPEFGTGAVKVTPAHDPNDFQAGLRHDLPQIDVMDDTAHMNQSAGRYAGLDRYEAREKILEDLRRKGLLAGSKDYVIPLGHCVRCGTVVEPRLSTQWFVAVNQQPKGGGPSIAGRAAQAVRSGEIVITPENYKQIYLNWMDNIYDWCISRQLWWGHRIPAWHCAACKHITVAREAPKACKCGSTQLEQDPDVLDTWFSSALLPFTAFGWPQTTKDLEVFYPTSLLITGFDILFFWVARMIMMGCHFMSKHPAGSVPFREVYIHSLVRDAERQKMSKTKGNVIDPIAITEKYGTDAVRFTLAAMASPGTDIAFNESRIEGYRAFANKIWNAARFIFMNVERAEAAGIWRLADFSQGAPPRALPSPATQALEDRWIFSRLNQVALKVNDALSSYRFHEAAEEVYQFFWGEFCDWYIEIVKPRLMASGDTGDDQAATRAAFHSLLNVFEASLRLLSPFMPFLTEELWHALYDGKTPERSIALAGYPEADVVALPRDHKLNAQAEDAMALLQELIVNLRNLRAELEVAPRFRVPVRIHADAHTRTVFEQNRVILEKMAGVESVEFTAESLAKEPAARSTSRFDVALVYEKKIDAAAVRARLTKELARLESERSNAEKQLSNDGFLLKAPASVVENLRKRAVELGPLIVRTRQALDELSPGC